MQVECQRQAAAVSGITNIADLRVCTAFTYNGVLLPCLRAGCGDEDLYSTLSSLSLTVPAHTFLFAPIKFLRRVLVKADGVLLTCVACRKRGTYCQALSAIHK